MATDAEVKELWGILESRGLVFTEEEATAFAIRNAGSVGAYLVILKEPRPGKAPKIDDPTMRRELKDKLDEPLPIDD